MENRKNGDFMLQLETGKVEQWKVNYKVLQGYVLGLVLFTLYIHPLSVIIKRHSINFHCYAHDAQVTHSREHHIPQSAMVILKVYDKLY